MSDIRYSDEIERQLAFLRENHAQVEGRPSQEFLCPILLRDERVPLCLGHIINRAIPNSYGGTIVQRQDVDGFYGRHFEPDFTARMQSEGKTPEELLLDPDLSKRVPVKLLMNGEEWEHYLDRGHAGPDHSRVEFNFGPRAALKWVVKKTPQEMAALGESGTIELAIGTDCCLSFLVSLIKAAYLTLFKLLGYSYALCVGGRDIGHGLLGAVVLEFAGLDTDEVRRRSVEYFRRYVNIMRPIERFTGKTPRGTVEDCSARVCCTLKGSFFGIIVNVRVTDQFFGVMLPAFNDADGVAAYYHFIKSDRNQLFTHNCQINPKEILVSQQLKEISWPKGDPTISLD